MAAASVPTPAAPGAAVISGAPSSKPAVAEPATLPTAPALPEAKPIAAAAKKIQVSLPSLPEPPTLIKTAPVQRREDSLTHKATEQELPALPPACELPPLFLDNDNMVY